MTTHRLRALLVLSILVIATFAGCGGPGYKSKPRGSEGGQCYPNGTCDTGLACKSQVCVDLGASGSDGGLTGASGTSAGGAAGHGTSGDGGSVVSGAGMAGASAGSGGQGGSLGSSGSAGQEGDPDGGVVDAGVDAGDMSNDAGPDGGSCDVSADYGTLSDLGGEATSQSVFDTVNFESYTADLPSVGGTTQFRLELFANLGVFTGDITTLDHAALSGDDLNYKTCGVCPLIYTQFTGISYDRAYYATSGTITLTSVDGNLTGVLEDATFEEVTITPGTFESVPVPGGCTTAISSVPFDATIVAN